MWMNEFEIEQALEIVRAHAPKYLPYVEYLSDWRDIINQNSDGWAYWRGGTKPASKLMDLVNDLVVAIRGTGGRQGGMPTVEEFQKALTPIKSAATRHKLPAPVLGRARAGVADEGDDAEFVMYVEERLIPDLRAAGNVETARDFERLLRIVRRATS